MGKRPVDACAVNVKRSKSRALPKASTKTSQALLQICRTSSTTHQSPPPCNSPEMKRDEEEPNHKKLNL
jgi:hypothetical protein